MDDYANVLMIAIPFFVLLIIIEALYGWWKGELSYQGMDTISSLSSGTTNTLKSVLNLSIIIISYEWLVQHVALIQFETNWLVWVLSFIAIDFASYWSHRLNHSINIFWNRHIVHHSSEEFNLACALRQPISSIVGLGFIFLFPAALLGLPTSVIGTIAPIHLFMQFWYHTRHIPKLGWLEYVLVTPSQHRVHHAINEIYLDKNLAAIFCIWDRMFGTFQEELDNEPCVYGVKKPVQTWNPIKINWLHAWQLTKDAWYAQSWWDKIRIWFMPLGWRPDDVAKAHPIDYIKDPKKQIKYNPSLSKPLQYWSWFQYLLLNVFLIHMLSVIADLQYEMLFIYGGFLFLMIYSFSALMDKELAAVPTTFLLSLTGLAVVFYSGDWFLTNSFSPIVKFIVIVYLIISPMVVFYFYKKEIEPAQQKRFVQ